MGCADDGHKFSNHQRCITHTAPFIGCPREDRPQFLGSANNTMYSRFCRTILPYYYYYYAGTSYYCADCVRTLLSYFRNMNNVVHARTLCRRLLVLSIIICRFNATRGVGSARSGKPYQKRYRFVRGVYTSWLMIFFFQKFSLSRDTDAQNSKRGASPLWIDIMRYTRITSCAISDILIGTRSVRNFLKIPISRGGEKKCRYICTCRNRKWRGRPDLIHLYIYI